MAQFDVYSTSVQNIISWIKSGEVAIPEIQRPFVWDASKVRDLLDSLYKGFPVGYIIVWKNPDVRLKDGTVSIGKKILIDGQQRVTALQAAIAGMPVTDSDYKKKRIVISFNPLTETFEVRNPAIEKDTRWISDIATIFDADFEEFPFIIGYCQTNGLSGQETTISKTISKVKKILDISIGVTDLNQSLSIDEVTDIFIRINSQGVVLSQADFAMSKISADDKYGGTEIRKMIDYFCHFMKRPADYEMIVENDTEFAKSDALQAIKWIVKEQEDIYVPSYTDILRVSFTHVFHRGKIADLVSLLSGRDFETRENYESIAEDSFKRLRQGVEAFVSETNFKRYLMIVQSTGIVDSSLVRSQNVLNFGYTLYLTLREQKLDPAIIESLVRRWIVLSMLTGRYSGSAESSFDYDIKRFSESDPVKFVENTEAGELSDAFWNNILVTRLDTSVASSPYFLVYLMAQVKMGSRGFLSKQITVQSLIEQRGDIHHIFPKKYLQKNGINNRKDYNQIANYIQVNKELQRVSRDTLKKLDSKDVMLVFPPMSSRTTTVQVLKAPKTSSSVRKIFLPRTVAEMLIRWKEQQMETIEALGDEYQDFDLVIAGPLGMPTEAGTINASFRTLIEKNDLPRVVFHSLRHSSITYKLKLNGGDVKAVQGDSGHAQVKMVTDVYSHILDDDRRNNARLFEEAFYSGAGKDPTKQEPEPQPEAAPAADVSPDTATLLKLLQNPEMAALLKTLAKSL